MQNIKSLGLTEKENEHLSKILDPNKDYNMENIYSLLKNSEDKNMFVNCVVLEQPAMGYFGIKAIIIQRILKAD